MTCFLFVWSITAIAYDPYRGRYQSQSWVNQGNFNSAPACHSAAKALAIKAEEYRCISRDGEVK